MQVLVRESVAVASAPVLVPELEALARVPAPEWAMVAWVPALALELAVSARVLASEWAVLASVLERAPELAELALRGAWVSAEARQELAQVRALQELVAQARELVWVLAA
ncbi:hypothetical protein [Bradyrhizobium yuanmingense]|uniref:hypothetical protein n=1 Tax=Bradyrhizobium yuanmingense TaxID=108015 RepID=UPI00187D6198|nr:hypothetical protein [Bradyrhizobium yuanmingense]